MFNLESALQKNADKRPGMPLVMGVLNVTPDSFSDGGQFENINTIEKRVVQMLSEGVDIIDVGGESTRPGADEVSVDIELQRVIPVIELIKQKFDIPVSIDTYKPEVMRQAVQAGADIVNDVNALQEPGAIELVAETKVYACLMHKQGSPKNMQKAPSYQNVVKDVAEFLLGRVKACLEAGIEQNKLILDPGFGFGKTLEHNTALFADLSELVETNYPVLVGVSRKRMIAEILDEAPVEQRVFGSVAAATLAGLKGAKIVRVHDVGSTVESLRVTSYLL
jgi:dihydropteroate synthase